MSLWTSGCFYNYFEKQSIHYFEQKRKFLLKGFFRKCDQICSFLRIWSHLLKKSLMEKFIFCALLVLLFYGWLWMDGSEVYLHFKHQPCKMVKYIQTIRRQQNVFDHFMWLGLKGLNALRVTYEKNFVRQYLTASSH